MKLKLIVEVQTTDGSVPCSPEPINALIDRIESMPVSWSDAALGRDITAKFCVRLLEDEP